MEQKYQNKYRVASARWQQWNYGWDGAYFITICTRDRAPFFGEVVNGKMVLSPVGVIADVLWHEITNHARHVELGEFVVMPNHIHGIIILDGNTNDSRTTDPNDPNNTDGPNVGSNVETRHALSLPSPLPENTPGRQRFQNQGKNTISSIVGGYKSAVTKHANRLGLEFGWQSRFHDHVIRDEKSFITISEYIINNPSNWSQDRFFSSQ
ncbi:transposase [Telluribacter sp. SYSU D00476]|uniref:transposase n=1 Tax=Telluribacter sp. SYSU D00476 TaxID=2811430 RepID=UPI001FF5B599|nr:transposase [Telluribacter sp. SYSU D00476]